MQTNICWEYTTPDEINPYFSASLAVTQTVSLLHYSIISLATHCEQGTSHINQVRSMSVVMYTENPPLSPELQWESTNKGLSRQFRTVPLIPLPKLEGDSEEDGRCKKPPSWISPAQGWKQAFTVRGMRCIQRTSMPAVSVWWKTKHTSPDYLFTHSSSICWAFAKHGASLWGNTNKWNPISVLLDFTVVGVTYKQIGWWVLSRNTRHSGGRLVKWE